MQTCKEYENKILASASHFVAVRGRSPSNRIRKEFKTIADAFVFGLSFGDKRTMVYAVTAEGRDAHICNA